MRIMECFVVRIARLQYRVVVCVFYFCSNRSTGDGGGEGVNQRCAWISASVSRSAGDLASMPRSKCMHSGEVCAVGRAKLPYRTWNLSANGAFPKSILYKSTPNAHTSAGSAKYDCCWKISGAA